MATLIELAHQGSLIKLNPGLRPRQQEDRLWYLSPRLRDWIANDLPNMESSWGIELTPLQQLLAFVEDYASGEPLRYQQSFHPIRHVGGGVWMLKTQDLRIFGWFWKKDLFIGHCAGWTEKIKLSNLYNGHAGEVVRFRDQLNLDEPKFITGTDPNDVLSNFSYP